MNAIVKSHKQMYSRVRRAFQTQAGGRRRYKKRHHFHPELLKLTRQSIVKPFLSACTFIRPAQANPQGVVSVTFAHSTQFFLQPTPVHAVSAGTHSSMHDHHHEGAGLSTFPPTLRAVFRAKDFRATRRGAFRTSPLHLWSRSEVLRFDSSDHTPSPRAREADCRRTSTPCAAGNHLFASILFTEPFATASRDRSESAASALRATEKDGRRRTIPRLERRTNSPVAPPCRLDFIVHQQRRRP